jgi:polyisoprenyl-teichoic acid--peptidoglycan teichoic acid transferase
MRGGSEIGRTERGPGRPLRVFGPLALALLALAAVLLAYPLLPFGGQRAALLGSDARGAEASRSDTIVVAKAGSGLLAVPRDTLVEIPGVGEDKINAAFAFGGPSLTVDALENLTGLPIDNYVVVHFDGVEEIVDALGTVTVEVEEPIAYTLEGRHVEIPAGARELDGFEALAYVRYRGDPTADIGRIGRQQRFILSLMSEVTSPAKLPRLPATARAVWNNIDTNMNPVEFGLFAARMRLSVGAEAEIYPGAPRYIDGISYWVPDEEAAEQVVARTIE